MYRTKIAGNQIVSSLEKTTNENKVWNRNGKSQARWLTLLVPASEAGIVNRLSPFFLWGPKIISESFLLYHSQQQLPADQKHLRRHLLAICGLLH